MIQVKLLSIRETDFKRDRELCMTSNGKAKAQSHQSGIVLFYLNSNNRMANNDMVKHLFVVHRFIQQQFHR